MGRIRPAGYRPGRTSNRGGEHVPNPKLQTLLRERQFYAAIVVGLPALLVAYALAWRILGLVLGADTIDVEQVGIMLAALGALLTANPIVVYLAARQYARGKAVEAVGIERAADPVGAAERDALDGAA